MYHAPVKIHSETYKGPFIKYLVLGPVNTEKSHSDFGSPSPKSHSDCGLPSPNSHSHFGLPSPKSHFDFGPPSPKSHADFGTPSPKSIGLKIKMQ